MKINYTRNDFPEDFDFGISASSYQIEGSAFGNCGVSQWDTFAATPGNVARGENGSRACEHYLRYEEDLDLLKQGGFDVYRFATSWARVLPNGTGQINQQGLDFYDALVDGLLKRSIKPVCMLYHWDLPAVLSEKGGWSNPDITHWFAEYAEMVMKRLGDRLHGAATITEPWCVAWLSHYLGLHAPGIRNIQTAVRAMHYVGLAHGRAVEAMRSVGIDNIGIALNFEYAEAAENTDSARAAALMYDGIYNRWFSSAMARGEYPADVLEAFLPYMPDQFEDDLQTIAAPIDWLGINYYTRKLILPGPSGNPVDFIECTGDLPQTTMGWEIYPEGLAHFLTRMYELFPQSTRILVTENGRSDDDEVNDGKVDDAARIDFINRHMEQVLEVINRGIPVHGYYLWSLLDNFEWALGYDKRFGLVHVNFDTMKRTPKDSFLSLAEAISRS